MPGKRITDHQVIKYKQYRQRLGQEAEQGWHQRTNGAAARAAGQAALAENSANVAHAVGSFVGGMGLGSSAAPSSDTRSHGRYHSR